MSKTANSVGGIFGGEGCVRCGRQPPAGCVAGPAPLCDPCALRTAREFAANFLICPGCGTVVRPPTSGPGDRLAFTGVADLVVRLAEGEYRGDCSHVICTCEGDGFCTCGKGGGDADAGEEVPLVTSLVM